MNKVSTTSHKLTQRFIKYTKTWFEPGKLVHAPRKNINLFTEENTGPSGWIIKPRGCLMMITKSPMVILPKDNTSHYVKIELLYYQKLAVGSWIFTSDFGFVKYRGLCHKFNKDDFVNYPHIYLLSLFCPPGRNNCLLFLPKNGDTTYEMWYQQNQ